MRSGSRNKRATGGVQTNHQERLSGRFTQLDRIMSSRQPTQVFSSRAIWLLLWLASSGASLGQEKMSSAQLQWFESKIRPVLVEHCYECHSAESKELGGGLTLDTREGIRQGGDSGPAVIARKPSSSLLLLAMKHADSNLVMPPEDYGDKLPDSVIADFERWIAAGAPDPRASNNSKDRAKSDKSDSGEDWWAWQPITPATVPQVANARWPSTDIDHFILSKLEQSGIGPSEPADRVTLVRRLAIDLTGLPPSSADLQRFALAETPEPIERLVDQYLASEQYGERFGRRWLDVARYAESTGKDVNVTYPQAYRYRDYVIDAFNADMPFDQFIREQIAGDLLSHASSEDRSRHTIATGFLAIGPKSVNDMNPRQFAVDVADEQIDAVSQAFLAVTIACARCHDHKFDPITQRDYTAMAGIFLSTQTLFGTTGGVAGRNRSTLIDLPNQTQDATGQRKRSPQELEEIRDRIAELEEERRQYVRDRQSNKSEPSQINQALRVSQQLVRLNMELDSLDDSGNVKVQVMGVADKDPPKPMGRFQQRLSELRSERNPGGMQYRGGRNSFASSIIDSPQLVRGEIDTPGETVPRGLPEFLSHGYTARIPKDQSGRLQVADWIADEDNSLTSRVIVNRVWSWMIGDGLVATEDNFGTSGELPSHPELLDYLADRFAKEGWSIKALVREIALSSTYQQSSEFREDGYQLDPENRLVWRANKRALDAESLRDGMLAISGKLALERPTGSIISAGGDGLIGTRRFGVSEDEITSATADYRSVYLPAPRNVLPDALELFDFADNSAVNGDRELTIVPSQALYWMNSPEVEKVAKNIALELLQIETTSDERPYFNRMRRRFGRQPGYRNEPASLKTSEIETHFEALALKVLSRPPLAAETTAVVAYVQEQQSAGTSPTSIWTGVVRSLLASGDYRFVR